MTLPNLGAPIVEFAAVQSAGPADSWIPGGEVPRVRHRVVDEVNWSLDDVSSGDERQYKGHPRLDDVWRILQYGGVMTGNIVVDPKSVPDVLSLRFARAMHLGQCSGSQSLGRRSPLARCLTQPALGAPCREEHNNDCLTG